MKKLTLVFFGIITFFATCGAQNASSFIMPGMNDKQKTYVRSVSAEGTLLKVIHGGGDIYIALEALTEERAQKKEVGFITVIYPNVRSEKWVATFWFNRPLVCELEYHDLGEKESFMGLWTSDEIKLNGKTMFEYKEIRIAVDAANFLIDFINGDTPLTDNSHLKVRVVKTPTLRKTEYHEPLHY